MINIMPKRNVVLSYFLITIGIFVMAFGWCAFMIPKQIIGGGVPGLSSIIYFLSGERIPVGVMNLAFNVVLVLLALKILGSKLGINTIYGILISSFFFVLLQQIIHIEKYVDISHFDPFMCSVIGGALAGAGMGLAFSKGGNSGGTDIIALMVNKYYNISPGKILLFIDIVIIGSSFFISHNIENVVYGYIQMVVKSYVLDLVLDGSRQSYLIIAFTKNAEDLAKTITSQPGHGVTLIDAKGGYSYDNKQVLMAIARKGDKPYIMDIIKLNDPKAFVAVAKVEGVYGKNFDMIKTTPKISLTDTQS